MNRKRHYDCWSITAASRIIVLIHSLHNPSCNPPIISSLYCYWFYMYLRATQFTGATVWMLYLYFSNPLEQPCEYACCLELYLYRLGHPHWYLNKHMVSNLRQKISIWMASSQRDNERSNSYLRSASCSVPTPAFEIRYLHDREWRSMGDIQGLLTKFWSSSYPSCLTEMVNIYHLQISTFTFM